MDLSYNVMRFGPKKRRIKIVHLKKPVTKGLAGLIESNLFPQRIAMVVDSRPLEDLNYNYMCLNYIWYIAQASFLQHVHANIY